MEFLLGNPYSTPVGQCIERATDGGLQNEDWTLNMEICDIINETDEGVFNSKRLLLWFVIKHSLFYHTLAN
uniref:Target of myb1 like 2 membrane trafficking protein n=1 Tax=Amphilophus citrinellus TaxID=61819 RepID=A0A3Q0RHW7_AMPCI